MKTSERYAVEIQAILCDIEIIKDGHVYEKDCVPGNPKCATIGARLEKNFQKFDLQDRWRSDRKIGDN